MNTLKIISLALLMSALGILGGCAPDFLDERPQKSLVVPKSIADMQALLGNAFNMMNRAPFLSLYADGDFTATESGLQSEYMVNRNVYLWSRDLYQPGVAVYDWDQPYKQIFYANVALEGLGQLADNSDQTYNDVKGQALFYRALALYNVCQQFAEPYQQQKAQTTLGVPIRLNSDILAKIKRSSLQQTYGQIISDLMEAQSLLPENSALITRPTKLAALAMLSRTYLTMGDYENCEALTRQSLAVNDKLLDYNKLDTAAASPFPNPVVSANPEIIFYTLANVPLVNSNIYLVDSALYQSYQNTDLRKKLFFNLKGGYKGSYTGQIYCFTGLATDELYLALAECLARRSETDECVQTLNKLLMKRYRTGRFSPVHSNNAKEALRLVLTERRKQLVARGSRWPDLRRLNQQPEWAVALRRKYQGVSYVLPANDKRYTFPIPEDEIQASGIQQNPR